MKTFFRDQMIVIPQALTIPSHEKTFRLLSVLRQDRQPELIADFPPVDADHWAGIHDPSYVMSVTKGDIDTFDAASIPVSD